MAMHLITLTCTLRNGQDMNFIGQSILPQFLKFKKNLLSGMALKTIEKVGKFK